MHHRHATNSLNYLTALQCRCLHSFTGQRQYSSRAAHSILSCVHTFPLPEQTHHPLASNDPTLPSESFSPANFIVNFPVLVPCQCTATHVHGVILFFSFTLPLRAYPSPLREPKLPRSLSFPSRKHPVSFFSLYFFRAISAASLNFSPNVLAFQFAFQSPLFHSRYPTLFNPESCRQSTTIFRPVRLFVP